jgi:hypothetical protein
MLKYKSVQKRRKTQVMGGLLGKKIQLTDNHWVKSFWDLFFDRIAFSQIPV